MNTKIGMSMTRTVTCSTCGGVGHNSRTCIHQSSLHSLRANSYAIQDYLDTIAEVMLQPFSIAGCGEIMTLIECAQSDLNRIINTLENLPIQDAKAAEKGDLEAIPEPPSDEPDTSSDAASGAANYGNGPSPLEGPHDLRWIGSNQWLVMRYIDKQPKKTADYWCMIYTLTDKDKVFRCTSEAQYCIDRLEERGLLIHDRKTGEVIATH
jgi:hypothetical protein